MVEIVESWATVEGQQARRAEGNIVPTVNFIGLKLALDQTTYLQFTNYEPGPPEKQMVKEEDQGEEKP